MMPYQLFQSHKTSPIIGEIVDQINAVRLAEFDARTSTICALTGLAPSKVRQIILAISSRTPQRGRGVENLEDYVKNKKHRRHISYIVHNYRIGIDLGMGHVEAIIQAYVIYQQALLDFTDPRTYIDIDHAFFLIKETNKHTDFDMQLCSTCGADYFYHKYELPQVCPFCTDKTVANLDHQHFNNKLVTSKKKIA